MGQLCRLDRVAQQNRVLGACLRTRPAAKGARAARCSVFRVVDGFGCKPFRIDRVLPDLGLKSFVSMGQLAFSWLKNIVIMALGRKGGCGGGIFSPGVRTVYRAVHCLPLHFYCARGWGSYAQIRSSWGPQGGGLFRSLWKKPAIECNRSGTHPAGAKQDAEKGMFSGKTIRSIPQGLKPTLILLRLRHD